jgi:hypothetical protein
MQTVGGLSMRRIHVGSLFFCAAIWFLPNPGYAQDGQEKQKDVVLKGLVTCARCDLAIEIKCATVLVVKDTGKKDVVYFFDPASSKRYHKEICTESKKATVEGTVRTDGKRKVISVSKLAYETPEKASAPMPVREKESGPQEPRGSRPSAGRPAGDHAAPPAEGKTALKFTALERNEPFYQVVETETRQTIKAAGKVVVRKLNQALYVRWTPLGKKDGKYQLRQQIIGLKLTIDTGGKTTTYDSTAPESKQTQDRATDFFKALPKREMIFTISPALEVVGVDGRQEFVRAVSEPLPAVKTSLDTMLSEKAVKKMAESLWSALPPRPVAVGERWKKASELDFGPIGVYTTSLAYTLQGVQGGQARIRTEASLTYKAPKDGTGLPYVIKKGELIGRGGTGGAVFNVRRGRFDSVGTSTRLRGNFSILVGNATTEVSIEQTQSATARCQDTNPLVQQGK